MKPNRAIYALYSNNKFVSWLYGAFCQLTDRPKFYWCGEDHERQSEIVLLNLKDKIDRVNKNSDTFLGIEKLDRFIAPREKQDYEILNNLKDFTLGVFFVNESESTEEFLKELSSSGYPNEIFEIN